LGIMQRALDDVGHTISRMREFYSRRESQLRLAPVDANRSVQQVADLTRARWRDLPQQRGIVIDLRTELDPSRPAIIGAESEIRDALTNLVFNAVDAMPEGGTLTLRTALKLDAVTRYVVFEVSDTGVGMDEATRRRCLEPFFTTKGDRGTGLGLAMVYGTVRRHGAELEIDSTPGRGTTVRLIFAAASTEAVSDAQRAPPARPVQRLRLLIVDDDPLLIQSLHDTLSGDGHAVTVADGGQAGIDAFRAAQIKGEPFAAVITDLGMPYVDGHKVASAIRAASPSTPIILLTGWGQRLMSSESALPNIDRVLSKPPKLRELRAALSELTVESSLL
jgi:CheY-like chemotaxis protein